MRCTLNIAEKSQNVFLTKNVSFSFEGLIYVTKHEKALFTINNAVKNNANVLYRK